MTCHELAHKIEQLQPNASPREVARLCLLLANMVEDVNELKDESQLTIAWQRVGLQLHAATDQHEAMTEELEALAASDPKKFTSDQIWILLRAIKVQSQVLQFYLGEPALNI